MVCIVYGGGRREKEEKKKQERKRGKRYTSRATSAKCCALSLSLGFFSVDGWLEKERKKELLGQGGIQLKRKGEGEGAGFFL